MQTEANLQGTTDFSDWKIKPENPGKALIFGCAKTLIWTAVAHVHSHRFPVSFFHESTTLFAYPQFCLPGVF